MDTEKNNKSFTTYLSECIIEFWNALKKPYSYSFYRNPYFFFGFLWGLPIPFFTIGTHLLLEKKSINTNQAILLIEQHPWLFIFPLHPILFGIIFGALGTIRRQQQDHISSLVDNLKALANTDSLTGLFNRRYFMTIFENELVRAKRNNDTFSIILFDIDNFKKVNDIYGHIQGDEVLRKISYVFKEHSRKYDTICRWGGEEFAILLPSTKEKEAYNIANRIRISFEQQIFMKDEQHFSCTISAGLTEFKPEKNHTSNDLIHQADQALYQAKETTGKNCVKAYCTPPS